MGDEALMEQLKKTNLLQFDVKGFTDWCLTMHEKAFRAKQLMHWIHQEGEMSFDQMTDLAKPFRQKLNDYAEFNLLPIKREHISSDGTCKWLFDVGTGNGIETVYIPEKERATLCISSQAGCAVNCSFCSTGKQGFSRNLTTAEIVAQLFMAEHVLLPDAKAHTEQGRKITNIVMMGMGEPLLNYDALIPALRLMLDDHAYGLSRRRVTVSTSGVVPMMERLAKDCPVALAVSLHAGYDDLRDRLVPLNQKYPLKDLLAACEYYLDFAPRDFITFEYVMLRDVNDTEKDIKALVDIARRIPCKFNLIPYNAVSGIEYQTSLNEQIRRFTDGLLENGVVVTHRKTRGDDIDAACGQLAGQVQNRLAVKTPRTEQVVRVHR